MRNEPAQYYDARLDEWFSTKGTGKVDLPFDLPGVQGLFVGGCVELGVGSSLHTRRYSIDAHAHLSSCHYHGWICIRSPAVYEEAVEFDLLWHEYAHLLADTPYHDANWRRILIFLGQAIPPEYAYRPRRQT